MSAANHVSVSHAALLLRHYFQVITPVTNNIVNPTRAAATLLIPMFGPAIHNPTVNRIAKAVTFSLVERDPILFSSAWAVSGA